MGKYKPEFNEKNQEKVNGEWVYTAKSVVRELKCPARKASDIMRLMEASWKEGNMWGGESTANYPVRYVRREDITRHPRLKVIDDGWFKRMVDLYKTGQNIENRPVVIDKEGEEVARILNVELNDYVGAYMALYGCKKPQAQKMFNEQKRINELKFEIYFLYRAYKKKCRGEELNSSERLTVELVDPNSFPPEHEYMFHGKKYKGRAFLGLSDFVSLADIRNRYHKE